MQKISLFHQFLLEMQPLLESYDKSDQAQYWPCLPKNIFQQNFNFHEFVSACKKPGKM